MKRMLGVGINKFADPSAQLNGCLNDVVSVRDMCTRSDSPLKISPEDVRLLCDERATRLNIFERLDWCSKNWPGDNDKLVIQFSCHGSQVLCRDGDELEDEQDEVLCPYDFPSLWDSPVGAPDIQACSKFLGRLPKPEICDDDIAVFLSRIPESVYTVLIIDACHSGTIDRDMLDGNPGHVRRPRFIRSPLDLANRTWGRKVPVRKLGVKPDAARSVATADDPNVHYITQRHILLSGCRDNQTSADAHIGGKYQGAMTAALTACLESCGFYEGKRPTWIQLHAQMLGWLKEGGYDQVPQLSGPQDLLEGPVFGDL